MHRVLGSGHKELADDLVLYSDGMAIDDPLLAACRARSADAPILLWAALVMADHRLASIVEGVLTDTQGKIEVAEFDTARLENALRPLLPGMGTRKAATNILSYYRDSGIADPEMQGNTIVGVHQAKRTGHAVPALVTYVIFRLEHLGLGLVGEGDLVRQALKVRANKWINLTPAEFRSAAAGQSSILPAALQPAAKPGVGITPRRAAAAKPWELSVTEVPVEAQNADRFAVAGASDRVAAKREQPLVLAYKAWMEGKGSKVVRLRYRPQGEADGIYCDIYDKTRNNLIEAKATATRYAIRMAIGQLIDYSRYMEPTPHLAVLTPSRPSADLLALLVSVGATSVWRDSSDDFRDNSGGSFV